MSRKRDDLSIGEQGAERRMGSEGRPGGFGRGRASYEEGPGGQGPARGGPGYPSTTSGEEPQPEGVVPVGGEDATVTEQGQTQRDGVLVGNEGQTPQRDGVIATDAPASSGGETGTGSGSTSGEGQ
jgi:hypothetical protein